MNLMKLCFVFLSLSSFSAFAYTTADYQDLADFHNTIEGSTQWTEYSAAIALRFENEECIEAVIKQHPTWNARTVSMACKETPEGCVEELLGYKPNWGSRDLRLFCTSEEIECMFETLEQIPRASRIRIQGRCN